MSESVDPLSLSRCQQIVTSPTLTVEQKRHFLALEAENSLPYPALPEAARAALDEGAICDMFEDMPRTNHATFCPITPNSLPTDLHGWNWKALRIWMTPSRC